MFHFQNCAFVFTKLDIRGIDKHLSGEFDFVPYNVDDVEDDCLLGCCTM
jgi:hypothetical protein